MPQRSSKVPTLPAFARVGEPEESEPHSATEVRQVAVSSAFLATIPKVVLSPEEVNTADLDHRDYFLVSLMDGTTSIEDLLDICGMPSDEAIALLEGLAQRGVVSLRG